MRVDVAAFFFQTDIAPVSRDRHRGFWGQIKSKRLIYRIKLTLFQGRICLARQQIPTIKD